MERFLNENCDVNNLSPLTLAFIGDTVFDLFVREKLVCESNRPVNKLHNLAAKKVNAGAQANAIKKLMPYLSEEETAIFKRGRNCKVNHKAKNATEGDYHYATGFESLFGYLYLKGNTERLRELFEFIMKEEEND